MTIQLLIINVIISFLIPLLGKNRKIGYGWSLVLCLFVSPIIGLIITLCSDKKGTDFVAIAEENNVKDKAKNYKQWGILFLLIAFLLIVFSAVSETGYAFNVLYIIPIPLIVLGIYFLHASDQEKKEEEDLNKWNNNTPT